MSAVGAAAGDFADFAFVRQLVERNTVDRLKQIIAGLNGALGCGIAKSGRKADHISAIQRQLDTLHANKQTQRWETARRIIKGEVSSPSTSTPGAGSSSSAAMGPLYTYSPPVISSNLTPSVTSGWQRPQAPLGRPPLPPTRQVIRFKPSPFYAVDHPLADLMSPSEVRDAQAKGTGVISFNLTADERAAISAGTHQVRLYCTSSQFHSSITAGQTMCPIEFPPVVEIRVNGTQVIGANTRGLKKKPGTAPPVDLSKLVRVGPNRVDFVYVNNTNPFVPRKYFVVANSVRYIPAQELVNRLRTGRARSAIDVKNALWNNAADDDEIQAGSQKLSLRCPLSYMRISTPCRSQACTHGQCFDALSWYSMMEQTTTYLCPVCDKTLNPEELIMDGFFNHILLNTPETVDDIIVEPDAEWHSADNKHYSTGYRPPKAASKAPTPRAPSVQRAPSQRPSQTPSSSRVPASSVVVIDSDDDDDDERVRTQLNQSSSSQSHQSRNSQKLQSQVIDLTLSSDDEAPPPPRPAPTSFATPNGEINKGKRKAISPPLSSGATTSAYDNAYVPYGSGALPYESSAKRPRWEGNEPKGRSPPPAFSPNRPLVSPSIGESRSMNSSYSTVSGSSGGGYREEYNTSSGSLPSFSSSSNPPSGGAPAPTSPSSFSTWWSARTPTSNSSGAGAGHLQSSPPSSAAHEPLPGTYPSFSSPMSTASINQLRDLDSTSGSCSRRPSYSTADTYGSTSSFTPPRVPSRLGQSDDNNALGYRSPDHYSRPPDHESYPFDPTRDAYDYDHARYIPAAAAAQRRDSYRAPTDARGYRDQRASSSDDDGGYDAPWRDFTGGGSRQ